MWYACNYFHSDLKKARADLEAMKKQAESTNREYDRLAEENQKLQVSNSCSGASDIGGILIEGQVHVYVLISVQQVLNSGCPL